MNGRRSPRAFQYLKGINCSLHMLAQTEVIDCVQAC